MPLRQRTNFSKAVRHAAWDRASGRCEGENDGRRCDCTLRPGFYTFDHIIPDANGGRATLENCQVLCKDCDRAKTASDQSTIADTRRLYEAHRGLRAPRRPMAGSRFGRLTRGFDGIVRDRASGRRLSRPACTDVRDL